MPRTKHDGLFKRCGHAARAWLTCTDPWWFRFHHAGHEYRFSLAREDGKPSGYVMQKPEAKTLQNKFRLQIQEGTFRQAHTSKPDDVRLTTGDVMDRYVEGHVRTPGRSNAGRVVMEAYIGRLRAMRVPAANGTTVAVENKPLETITVADLDTLRRDWALNAKAVKGGQTGPNRALKRLRHFFNWAILQGYIEKSPFTRGGVATVKFTKEPGRTRRLEGDEEERLLACATTPLLKALITAALETGCRVGELLHLKWADVKADVIVLPAEITKTRDARAVPVTQNLRAMLDLRRHAPDGRAHGPDAHVFGTETGAAMKYGRVRVAFRAACTAAKVQGANFHDLRRTAASTIRASGAPDHVVAQWLGHANISTTSKYLRASESELTQHVKDFERTRAAQQEARQDSHIVRTRAGSQAPPARVDAHSNSLN